MATAIIERTNAAGVERTTMDSSLGKVAAV